jgi:hypothetical protein
MQRFNKTKWQVLYASLTILALTILALTILALAIAAGAPGQYTTPG